MPTLFLTLKFTITQYSKMSLLINPLPLIKALTNEDKSFVKQLFYQKFAKASKTRYRDCLVSGKFSILEKNFFSNLFIEENGEYVLDYSDEMIQEIS